MIDKKDIEKLIASAYSAGPKTGKSSPNILRELLLPNSKFNFVQLYITHCYYSCGYSVKKLIKLLNRPVLVKEVKAAVKSVIKNSTETS